MPTARADAAVDVNARSSALLVVRARLGDRAALDALLRSIDRPLWNHIRVILGDEDAASDVLQDTLLTIARKLGGLRDPRWFRAWSYRIATRAAVRELARTRRRLDRPSSDDELLERVPMTVEEPTFDPALIELVPELVAALPPASRIVVRMRYLEEMSIGEIAEALEIPHGTVKSRLMYGIERLRRGPHRLTCPGTPT